MSAWRWLVDEGGLYRALVGALVGVAVTGVVVPLVFAPLRRAWREHVANQQMIADRLDTSTPGGLADLLPGDEPRYRYQGTDRTGR